MDSNLDHFTHETRERLVATVRRLIAEKRWARDPVEQLEALEWLEAVVRHLREEIETRLGGMNPLGFDLAGDEP